MVPDIIVGDLDSISPETLAWAKGNNVAVREFPPEKDKTDLELALEEAIARGADEVTLTGAWGGRIDQTLANLFLLRAAKDKGVACAIRESAGEIFLVDKALTVLGESGDTVSLLALEDARGVALEGFKYMISDGLLAVGSTLGVSNELVGNQGKIELQSGLILVIHSGRGHSYKLLASQLA